MIKTVLFSIWFMLPAAAANATPVFAAAMPGLRRWTAPIDGGRTFRGKALFGSHKTWRGLVTGMFIAAVTFWLQQLISRHGSWVGNLSSVDYGRLPFVLGPLFGFGALGGDAIKSFFKRQRGIASGKSWPPFDQLDFVIGAVLVSLPFVMLTVPEYICIFLIWFGAHLLSTYIGWRLGLKDSPI